MSKSDIVRRFLTEVRSPDEFASYFAEDAFFKFANFPAVHGREGVKQSSVGFRQRVKGVRHDIHDLWETGDIVICAMDVIYTRLDDKQVIVPGCDTIKFTGDLFQEMRIYIDTTPVFAP